MSRLSIVTPCFNEEEALPHLYEKLKQIRDHGVDGYELEFVFVNDGSSDRTDEVLATAEAELTPALVNVVTHEQNRGLGASLNTGFEAATGELVAALDCDCTYDPMYIPDMVAKLDDETDVLTGSEFHPDGHVEDLGPFRFAMSRGMSLMYQITFQSRLWSFSCLLRIYRKQVLDNVKIESNGFLSCTEILIKALSAGYRVKEYPLTLTTRQHGDSKIPVVKTILEHLHFVTTWRWKLWMEKLRSPSKKPQPEPVFSMMPEK